jgi:hypothetical protein
MNPTGSTLLSAAACAMTYPAPVYPGIHSCPVMAELLTEEDINLTECPIIPRNESLPVSNQILYNQIIRFRARPIYQKGGYPIRNFRLARNANANARRKHSIHQPGRTNCTQRYQLKM